MGSEGIFGRGSFIFCEIIIVNVVKVVVQFFVIYFFQVQCIVQGIFGIDVVMFFYYVYFWYEYYISMWVVVKF